ncbi:alanine/glycine:cation symporter family protein [Glycomyces buryatensis]|uniref:Alanine:cation symporter family protein n=1 Tax=Glycomyces buryatensis TaxID=2570927 RepID=A0A4S8QEA1_9ACTN|nr:alanine/glycine:cation symporter family protein [Glycomyces buryatensis]THV42728.1 alanine:cation symporter family protein [Glycomyces buryatensis]
MDELITQIMEVNDYFWWFIIILLAGTSLIYLFITKGVQFRLFGQMVRGLREAPKEAAPGEKPTTAFQAFAVSAAARVGTGNIVGVSAAIGVGGPGAVFWMWLMAIIVAGTAFAESTLAQVYKERTTGGGFKGGPAFYMKHGLGLPWAGGIFAVILLLTYPVAFNMVQANTFTASVNASLTQFGDVDTEVSSYIIGAILAIVAGVVIFGGLKRIADTAELLVPIMAAVYLLIGIVVVVVNFDALPGALADIVQSALGLEQFAGATIGTVIIQGVRRGMFSNEGGMGSAPNAGATATVSHPVKQGLTQALGVYFDTIFLCTISALIILTTNPVYGTEDNLVTRGVEASLGGWSLHVMTVILMLFTFTSVLGNYFYGESNIRYLTGSKHAITGLRLGVVALAFWGSIASFADVWGLADVTMGMMATVNLLAVLALTGVTWKVLADYDAQRKQGLDPVFTRDRIPGLKNVQVWEPDKVDAVEKP